MALSTPSSTEVKDRKELYLHFPSGFSWSLLGCNLLLLLPVNILPGQPIAFHVVKTHPTFMESELSLPCPQGHAAGFYPEPDASPFHSIKFSVPNF
jgi:hypothetical protein